MRISDWSSDVCSSDLMALQSAEQRPAGDVLDGLHGARPAVEGDQEALDRPEGARRHQDGPPAGPDDALEVRSQVQLREIRRLAALPCHGDARALLPLAHRLADVPAQTPARPPPPPRVYRPPRCSRLPPRTDRWWGRCAHASD